MRDALLAVLAALMLVTALPAALPPERALAQVPAPGAGAQPQPYAREEGILQTTTGPADAEIPVSLDYDLYLPAGATAADPQPAVVVAHGFGNTKRADEVLAIAAHLAGQGYVVLTSTHMGFGGSSGCIALDLAQYDARNVSSLIDLLADRPEVLQEAPGDPVVGMVGGSYGGGHQGGVASTDARVDAIAPHRTWNALQYSLVPNNLVTTGLWDLDDYEQGVFKQTWTSLFYAVGSSQPLQGGGGCDPLTQQTLYPGMPPCPGFDPRVCPIFASLAATGDISAAQRDLIAGSSMGRQVADVDVPILLLQGRHDTLFTLTEAIATYEAHRNAGGQAQLVLNWGGHGYQPRPGEGEPYSGAFDDTPESQAVYARTYIAGRILDFMDVHLRGAEDPHPPVAYFRDWVDYDVAETGGTAAPAYGTATDHPVGGVTAFALDAGAERLRPAGEAPADLATASLVDPPGSAPAAHSETPNFSDEGQPGAARQPAEVPGQHATFDTDPLAEAVEVVGVGTALLDVASAADSDVMLFTKLYDVAPDGTATLIDRLVAAARIPAAQLPGPALVRLPGIVHRFEAGHAIRLVVATTDDSYRTTTGADQVTLTTGGATASAVSLPTTDGPVVDRVAGPDRVATAVALSRRAFASADTAVLAAGGGFADALAAGGLAAAVDGPLLLVGGQGLGEDVRGELDRLGVRRVVIAGGPAAVPPAVEAELGDRAVQRIAGVDRYATAAALARETARVLGGVDRVVLARGDDPADALAAGSLAAAGAPVLLTGTQTLDRSAAAALDALDPARVLVAGGSAAIGDGVVAQLGRPAERLAGATRYDTAAALVRRALDGRRPGTVLLASGLGFADALAAGPAAAALGGVLMITDPADLAASPAAADVVGSGTDRALLVGGYAAVGPRLDGQVALAVGRRG